MEINKSTSLLRYFLPSNKEQLNFWINQCNKQKILESHLKIVREEVEKIFYTYYGLQITDEITNSLINSISIFCLDYFIENKETLFDYNVLTNITPNNYTIHMNIFLCHLYNNHIIQ